MLEILIFFIFAVVIGLMFTFFGYPFFRLLLPIWAFFAGLVFGVHGIESLLGYGFISVALGLLIGFIIGIILAIIAYTVYKLAIYLFGITLGYVLGSGLMLILGFNPGLISFLVGAGAAVLLTVLFAKAKMPRFLIIFLTAAGGSMGVISGLFVLFGKVPTIASSLELTRYMVSGSLFWLIIWAVLAGLGIAFQYAASVLFEDQDLGETYVWEKEYKGL